jgi:hypothetical protein
MTEDGWISGFRVAFHLPGMTKGVFKNDNQGGYNHSGLGKNVLAFVEGLGEL